MSPAAPAAIVAAMIFLALAASGRLRRMAGEFPDRGRLALGMASLWVVLYAAIAIPVVTSGSAEPPPISDLSFLSLFAGHAILTAFLLAWWQLRRPLRLDRFLFLRTASFDDITAGLGLGFRVWGVTVAVAVVAGAALQIFADGMQDHRAGIGDLPPIPDVMVWMANLPLVQKLLIVFAAMTVEEAFFRAYLQTRIGLLPSSVLFAVAHASYGLPTLMLGVFVVSLVIGRDFARHRRLLRCVVAHGVFDVIQLVLIVPWAVRQLAQFEAAM